MFSYSLSTQCFKYGVALFLLPRVRLYFMDGTAQKVPSMYPLECSVILHHQIGSKIAHKNTVLVQGTVCKITFTQYGVRAGRSLLSTLSKLGLTTYLVKCTVAVRSRKRFIESDYNGKEQRSKNT